MTSALEQTSANRQIKARMEEIGKVIEDCLNAPLPQPDMSGVLNPNNIELSLEEQHYLAQNRDAVRALIQDPNANLTVLSRTADSIEIEVTKTVIYHPVVVRRKEDSPSDEDNH